MCIYRHIYKTCHLFYSVLLFGSSRMQSAPTSPCGWRSLKALKARISPSPKSWRRKWRNQKAFKVSTICTRNISWYVLVPSRTSILMYILYISVESAPEPFHAGVSEAHCTNSIKYLANDWLQHVAIMKPPGCWHYSSHLLGADTTAATWKITVLAIIVQETMRQG